MLPSLVGAQSFRAPQSRTLYPTVNYNAACYDSLTKLSSASPQPDAKSQEGLLCKAGPQKTLPQVIQCFQTPYLPML